MELNVEKATKLDPGSMYSKIYHLPEQLRKGYSLELVEGARKIDPERIENIVVAGMGGSAIAGDLIRSYLATELKIPIYISRNYTLPRFVDDRSLVITSSYSGNTEETLSAYGEANKRGAMIFVATTGGTLGELALRDEYSQVQLPTGYQPRAALGFSFGPLLRLLEKLQLVPEQSAIVRQTCDFLATSRESLAITVPEDNNPAMQIAGALRRKIVLVYAGADCYDTVALRIKGQICENSKQLAFANVCPEFNHNEIVGFEHPPELLKDIAALILIGPGDSARIRRRFEVVDTMLQERSVETIVVNAIGPNRLAEIFSLIQIGDFVSFYLALLNGVDPSPVAVIDRLKQELEKTN